MDKIDIKNAADESDAHYVAPSFKVELGKAPGMKSQLLSEEHGRKVYVIVFAKGDEVISGLNEFAQKNHVTSAHFTAIGSWSSATLGWFSSTRKMYKRIPIEEQVEVASMIGDIALLNTVPVVHSHVVVGLSDGTAKAGHILEAYVWPTLEVIVRVEPNAMYKRFDSETGLSLIDPSFADKQDS